jgi:DNA-binding response OmpR family regulator
MRVLIVEDDVKLSRLLGRVFSEEGFAADVCRDGETAVGQAATGIYDLVLLDWMLPEKDGLSVCRELRRRGCLSPILMLTARGEVHDKVLGLREGADDYLAKPFEVEELLARAHALLRRARGTYQVELGPLQLDRVRRLVALDGAPLSLTAREMELLLHLAHHPDEVVTRSALLTSVWDLNFDPESNVVDVHISRLRDKLGPHAWMIETVRGRGYRLRTRKEP